MNLSIIPMKIDMLEEVAELDTRCFGRVDNPRTVPNLQTMYEACPGGCFVVTGPRGGISAYVFGHRFGTVGYLGPLGVAPEYRKMGIGRLIVNKGIEALANAGCRSIGLEVLPESGYNVGLYLRSKFVATYPTIMVTRSQTSPARVQASEEGMISGCSVNPAALKEFDSSLRRYMDGYSFIHDIEWAINTSPEEIHFYIDNNKIIGFLGFTPDLYPFVWGAIMPCDNTQKVFTSLFATLEQANLGKPLKIRINTRYTQLYQAISHGFKVERCFMRLMLQGYEDCFLSLDREALVCRAWMG